MTIHPQDNDQPHPVDSKISFQEILAQLVRAETLNEETSRSAFQTIMHGEADEAQIGALLAMMQMREVTVEELTGAARVMRQFVKPLAVDESLHPLIIDTCGTGGAQKTFNISTAAAIVAAGAGAKVAKHGNRSRTGRGSAEILQALGVNIDATPEIQNRCLLEAGVSFSFAVNHHPAVKYAMPARRALNFPTIFNLLGPLTNPAGALRQLIGVYQSKFTEPMAKTLHNLGSKRAFVVHGKDGLDELTTTAPTIVSQLKDGKVSTYEIDARDYKINRTTLDQLQVNSLDQAVTAMRAILDNQPGPKQDIVIMNAAMALMTADLADNLQEGITAARQSIESGNAKKTLQMLVTLSNS